jgi:hypothetical protein
VSPLWPNQVYISLAMDQLALVYRTGITKHMLAQRQVSLDPQTLDWHAILQQLEIVLTSLKLPTNTQLHIVLASDLVRYLTLPAQDTQMSHVEKLAYAKAAYREVYGTITGEWRIQCNDAAPDRAIVAAAIDDQLFDAIQLIADKFQLKLKEIQPYLMHAFNHLSRQIGKTTALLAIVESNRLLLININQGDCQQVRNQKLMPNWQEMLNQLLTRESLLGEQENREILVYAPTHKSTTINVTQDWQLKRLGISSQSNKPAYAMLEAAL